MASGNQALSGRCPRKSPRRAIAATPSNKSASRAISNGVSILGGRVGAVSMPFSARYEINGRPFQEEQIKAIHHNAALTTDAFAVPEMIRNQRADATPIASQWILRRIAGNVSYQDFGRAPSIEWIKLVDGVYKVAGGSHATIVVEMRDHLIAVEGPLYEARTAPVWRVASGCFAASAASRRSM